MEKINRTIDDIFEMSDSRYSLVNAISRKAREIADEAENNNDVLYRKPVNMVIDRLLDGRATIEHIEEPPADTQRHSLPVEVSLPVYAELEDGEEETDENGDSPASDDDDEDRPDDEEDDTSDEGDE